MSGRRRLVVGLATAVALAVAAVFLWPRSGEAIPSYKDVNCRFGSNSVHRVTCSELIVPQDWTAPDGRSFRLPVITVKARSGQRSAQPVVFLSGGPGDSSYLATRNEALYWQELANIWFDDRDLIVIELRGSYKSQPSLMCPKLNDPVIWAGLWPQDGEPPDATTRFYKLRNACLKRLTDNNVALHTVNRHQVARDIKELAKQQGNSKIALLGISYGTTYAMTVMQDYPELVSAVILDSVFPPEATRTIRGHLTLQRTIVKYAAACKRDTKCKSSYADFRSAVKRVLTRLNIEPVDIDVQIPGKSGKFKSRIDGLRFFSAMRTLMMKPEWLNYVPQIVNRIDEGNEESLKLIIQSEIETLYLNNFSFGVINTAGCYDLPQGLTQTDVSRQLATSSEITKLELEFLNVFDCIERSVPRAPQESRTQLVSPIPTLILAGAFDPATPPFLARMASKGLKNAHTFVFPFGTHALSFTNSCANELIWDFLKSPLKRPDRSCFKLEPKPNFQ